MQIKELCNETNARRQPRKINLPRLIQLNFQITCHFTSRYIPSSWLGGQRPVVDHNIGNSTMKDDCSARLLIMCPSSYNP